MKAENIGIYLDHAVAHILEVENEEITAKNIKSEFTHEEKELSIRKNENLMHNKEQHLQAKYYKQIIEQALDFKNILLFGPTTAKSELWNLIKDDLRFKDSKIELKQADKMTENQQLLFVKEYFNKT
ncbi:MAG: hypothetical protein Q7W45_09675 [Bacteroidota bacterium]|nr:hypothetical protein [Bacteroidota bacterium]MDP3144051.1 hypothetical protein [Bacteroidota bacterium]